MCDPILVQMMQRTANEKRCRICDTSDQPKIEIKQWSKAEPQGGCFFVFAPDRADETQRGWNSCPRLQILAFSLDACPCRVKLCTLESFEKAGRLVGRDFPVDKAVPCHFYNGGKFNQVKLIQHIFRNFRGWHGQNLEEFLPPYSCLLRYFSR